MWVIFVCMYVGMYAFMLGRFRVGWVVWVVWVVWVGVVCIILSYVIIRSVFSQFGPARNPS